MGRARCGPGTDMDHLEMAETRRRVCSQFARVCRGHGLIAGY